MSKPATTSTTDAPTPLISATDPRAEARANASATRTIMATRAALLEQQIAALTDELRAVRDTETAMAQLDATLTASIDASHQAALQ